MITVKGYRVLIKPDMVDLKTPSGIVIAADKKIEQAAQQYGEIVQIGDQCWPNQDGFEVGDYVIYARYQGRIVADPQTKEQYLVMNDEDVLAKCDRAEEHTFDDLLDRLDERREST